MGDGASGLALAIAIIIGAAILLPGVVLAFIAWRLVKARKLPGWTPWIALPLGIALGVFTAFFVIFDDLGEAWLEARIAPTVEVEVPVAYRGKAYLFFDPALPPLVATGPKRYRVAVPDSGRALVGPFTGLPRLFGYARFELRDPAGQPVPGVTFPLTRGGFNAMSHASFFIGSDTEYERDYIARRANDTLFDEEQVYRALKNKLR